MESDEEQGKTDLQIKFALLRKLRSRPVCSHHNENKKNITATGYSQLNISFQVVHSDSIHIATEDSLQMLLHHSIIVAQVRAMEKSHLT